MAPPPRPNPRATLVGISGPAGAGDVAAGQLAGIRNGLPGVAGGGVPPLASDALGGAGFGPAPYDPGPLGTPAPPLAAPGGGFDAEAPMSLPPAALDDLPPPPRSNPPGSDDGDRAPISLGPPSMDPGDPRAALALQGALTRAVVITLGAFVVGGLAGVVWRLVSR